MLRLWDANTGQPRREIPGRFEGTTWSNSLFSPGGNVLAVTNGEGAICVYELATGVKQRTWLSPLSFGSSDPLWNPNSVAALAGRLGPPSPVGPLSAAFLPLETLERETTWRLINFSADGKTLLTHQHSGVLAWWDVATGQQIRRYTSPGDLDCYHVAVAGEHENRFGPEFVRHNDGAFDKLLPRRG